MLQLIVFIIFCVGCHTTWQWLKKHVGALLFAGMRETQAQGETRPRARS